MSRKNSSMELTCNHVITDNDFIVMLTDHEALEVGVGCLVVPRIRVEVPAQDSEVRGGLAQPPDEFLHDK